MAPPVPRLDGRKARISVEEEEEEEDPAAPPFPPSLSGSSARPGGGTDGRGRECAAGWTFVPLVKVVVVRGDRRASRPLPLRASYSRLPMLRSYP